MADGATSMIPGGPPVLVAGDTEVLSRMRRKGCRPPLEHARRSAPKQVGAQFGLTFHRRGRYPGEICETTTQAISRPHGRNADDSLRFETSGEGSGAATVQLPKATSCRPLS